MCDLANILLQVVYMFNNPTDSGAVQLSQANIDETLGTYVRTYLPTVPYRTVPF